MADKISILPGEHPHIDDTLMKHLFFKGVWRCRCLKVGLDKKKGNIKPKKEKKDTVDLIKPLMVLR